MRQKSLKSFIIRLRICVIVFILSILSLFLFSFAVKEIDENIFKELGIDKYAADHKISSSLLGGYLDAYGLKNAKNIAVGNRTALVKNLLEYTHQFTTGSEFRKAYNTLRENNKPVQYKVQTPEEMRRDMVASYTKSIAELEDAVKKADAKTKKIFTEAIVETRKQLRDAEDPNHPVIANYAKSFDQLVASGKLNYEQQIEEWEKLFPENGMAFVKKRLIKFLEETKDIDFNAALTTRNGKKVFVNPAYERKNKNWKMAFRAGKEVVEPARAYVSQWVSEIN